MVWNSRVHRVSTAFRSAAFTNRSQSYVRTLINQWTTGPKVSGNKIIHGTWNRFSTLLQHIQHIQPIAASVMLVSPYLQCSLQSSGPSKTHRTILVINPHQKSADFSFSALLWCRPLSRACSKSTACLRAGHWKLHNSISHEYFMQAAPVHYLTIMIRLLHYTLKRMGTFF